MINLTVLEINGDATGVLVEGAINGALVDEDTTHTAPTADEFRRDLIVADEDGAVSVVEGDETDDQDADSAVAPDLSTGDTLIAVALVTDDGSSGEQVDAVEVDDLGAGGYTSVSADESHVA